METYARCFGEGKCAYDPYCTLFDLCSEGPPEPDPDPTVG